MECELSFVEYSALSSEEQYAYDRKAYDEAPVLDTCRVNAMMQAVSLGTAFSLSDAICKIFQFVLRIAKQVISVISEVTKDLLGATFEILGEALGGASKALFSSPLGIAIVAGLGLWAASKLGLFGKKKDEEEDERSTREAAEDAAKRAVVTYYTGGMVPMNQGSRNV